MLSRTAASSISTASAFAVRHLHTASVVLQQQAEAVTATTTTPSAASSISPPPPDSASTQSTTTTIATPPAPAPASPASSSRRQNINRHRGISLALPRPTEVADFANDLEKLALGLRVQQTAKLAAAAVSLTTEARAHATVARQLAHTVLTKDILSSDDVTNPARNWTRTYQDLESDIAARDVIIPGSGGGVDIGSGSGRGGGGGQSPSQATKRGGGNLSDMLSYFDMKDNANAAADAAFGSEASLYAGAARESAQRSAASSSSSSSGEGSMKLKTVSSDKDTSPLIGGALSYIAHGSLAPSSSAVTGATSTSAGLLYLDAVIEQLQGIRDGLKHTSSSSATTTTTPTGFDSNIAAAVVQKLVLVTGGETSSASSLTSAQLAWVASLSASHASELQRLVAAARISGSVSSTAASVKDRIQKLDSAIKVLVDAKSSTTAPLPSMRKLFQTLNIAVTSSSSSFTTHASAAAEAASHVIASLKQIETQLNAAATRAAAAATTTKKKGGAAASSGSSAFTVSVPTITDMVSNSPSVEVTTVHVKEVASGRSFSFPLESEISSPSSFAAPQSVQEAVNQRLEQGHVPTMLSPLMKILTPQQWFNVDIVARSALPDWSACLGHAVGSVSSSSGADATLSGGVSVAPHVPTLVGAGENAVSVVARSLASPSNNSNNVKDTTTTTASSTDADSSVIVNPTGTPNSVLTAIAQRLDLGTSTTVGTSPIKQAVETAPSELSRRHYLSFLLRSRVSREKLTQKAFMEAEIEAAIAKLPPSASSSAADALRTQLTATWNAATSTIRGDSAERNAAAGAAAAVGPHALQAAVELETIRLEELISSSSFSSSSMSSSSNKSKNKTSSSSTTSLKHIPGLTVAGDLPPEITPSLIAEAIESFEKGTAVQHATTGKQASDAAASTTALLHTPVVDSFTRIMPSSVFSSLSSSAAVGLSATPLPIALPWQLVWAAERASLGFPKSSSSSEAATTVTSSSSSSSTSSTATTTTTKKQQDPFQALAQELQEAESKYAPITTVVRMPKAAINAELVARTGTLSTAFATDEFQRTRQARLGAIQTEIDLKDAARAASLAASGGGRTTGTTVADIDPRWWRYTYGESSEYRDYPTKYAHLHYVLLEAMEAKDLDAVWALWTEHCALLPQEGQPDILALEIVMDACARAQRPDLVYGVLWPRIMQLHIVPTSSMRLILIKTAALLPSTSTANATDLAENQLKLALKTGANIDVRHYHAVISTAVAHGEFARAYALFNAMKRRGVGATAALFATLLEGAAAAQRLADCHYIWKAVSKSHIVSIPSTLYTRFLEIFAQQGNFTDMEAVVVRMRRKMDGAQRPVPSALVAMLQAYVVARDMKGAQMIVSTMEADGHFKSGAIPREPVDSILKYLKDGSIPQSKVTTVAVAAAAPPSTTTTATGSIDDGVGVLLEQGDEGSVVADDDNDLPAITSSSGPIARSLRDTTASIAEAAATDDDSSTFFDKGLLGEGGVEGVRGGGGSSSNKARAGGSGISKRPYLQQRGGAAGAGASPTGSKPRSGSTPKAAPQMK